MEDMVVQMWRIGRYRCEGYGGTEVEDRVVQRWRQGSTEVEDRVVWTCRIGRYRGGG